MSDLPGLLPKRVAFESERLAARARGRRSTPAGRARADAGLVESAARAVKERTSSTRSAGRRRSRTSVRAAGARSASSAAPSASSPGGSSGCSTSWRRGRGVPVDRRLRAERRAPAREPGDVDRGGQTVVVDAGARSTATAPTARARSRRASCRTSSRAPTRSASRRSASARGVPRRRLGRDVDAMARDVIDAAGFGELFGHGLGHGVGMEIHEVPGLRPESEATSAAGTSSPSSRASTSRATAASASRISSSSPTASPRS